jgi:UDP-GlcNAc:undecaprenyl-phosphate/decaprenyl-phosphate GlcNAc-1-phosphate transferase
MTRTVTVVAVVSFILTLVATPLCILVARRSGTMDRAGPLKPQAEPVPYLGGVAVFAGIAVGLGPHRPSTLIPLTGALLVGLADDRWDLEPSWRLLAQIAVGAAIVLTQPVHLAGWLAAPLIIVVTVVVINGVNLLDGLDMLAAGVTAAASLGFASLVHGTGRLLAVSLGASLLAFLVFNRPPARIYLGDAGSYLIGTALAVLLTTTWAPGVSSATGLFALALLAIPVAELTCAVVRRVRGRRALTAGDRNHPYDQLVRSGWSRLAASVVYIGAELAVVVVVALVPHHSVGLALAVDIAVAACLLVAAGMAGGLAAPAEATP